MECFEYFFVFKKAELCFVRKIKSVSVLNFKFKLCFYVSA